MKINLAPRVKCLALWTNTAKCSQNGNLEIKPGTALRLSVQGSKRSPRLALGLLFNQSLGPGMLLLLSPALSWVVSGLPGRWVDGVRWSRPPR